MHRDQVAQPIVIDLPTGERPQFLLWEGQPVGGGDLVRQIESEIVIEKARYSIDKYTMVDRASLNIQG